MNNKVRENLKGNLEETMEQFPFKTRANINNFAIL